MYIFLMLGLLGAEMGGASSYGSADLGTHAIRDQWHEARTSPEIYERYQKQHFFVDIAEEKWAYFTKLKAKSSDIGFSKDVELSSYQARRILSEEPFRIDRWASAYVHSFRNIVERPFDGTREIQAWVQIFAPPFVFALILVLCFHLWIWSPAISKDFPVSFGSNSRFIVFTLLLTSIFWAMKTVQWTLLCQVLICLSLIYSRRPFFFKTAAFFGALIMTVQPAAELCLSSLSDLSASEAIEKGRTRLEYTPSSLAELNAIEKAVWSELNGDILQANYWVEKAPPSKDKEILEANLKASLSLPKDSLERYEDLRKRYATDPVVLYNLVQLNIRAQNLTRADEIRALLGQEKYDLLSTRSLFTDRPLLYPLPSNRSAAFGDLFEMRVRSYLAQTGLYPFAWKQGLPHLFYLIIPWLLLFWALYQRPYSSGLCTQTGGVTSSPNSELSPLYLSLAQKSSAYHSQRQQVDLLVRKNLQVQHRRISLWSWVLPGVERLIFESSPPLCLIESFFCFLVLWASFSWECRQSILHYFHHENYSTWGQSTFSLPLFVGFLLAYFSAFSKSRRKLYR